MKVEKGPPAPPAKPLRSSLKEGIQFAFGFSPISTILILLSILSLIGTPYITLFPALADQTFKGGAHTLATLTVFSGMGALTAAILLASRKSVLSFGKMIGLSAFTFALGLLALSFTSHLGYALPVLFVTGFTMMLQMASSNMVIQTLVEDDKRGRVMSMFSLALMGVSPFGGLLVGALAQKFGIFHTMVCCGTLYLFVSLWFIGRLGKLSETVEPIYLKLGILTTDQLYRNGRKKVVF